MLRKKELPPGKRPKTTNFPIDHKVLRLEPLRV